MAKRSKHAIALFEVITATKRKEAAAAERRSLGGGSPRWFKGWGKRAEAGDVDPTSDAYVAAALSSPATQFAPLPSTAAAPAPSPEPQPEPQQVVASAAPVVSPEIPAAPAPVPAAIPVAQYAPEPAPVPTAPAWPGALNRLVSGVGAAATKVAFQSDGREVTVRFRYPTAIIAGFALVVAIALAYVSGRRSSTDLADNAPSSKDVQSGAILAGVLEPERDAVPTLDTAGPDVARAEAVTSRAQFVAPRAAAAGVAKAVTPPRPADKWSAAGIQVGRRRDIGLNYVIIQSYPTRKEADAARGALEAGGIPCTVEPVPLGWSRNPEIKYSVIGIHGFPRTMTMPEYRQYLAAIHEVSKQFAGKSKIKQFEPIARKWK